ncbi:MAG: VWA domain-containing protein [Fimbriimonadaceae bacterium]|nr:VWA domain-containing protein [Fimbriimonadaceae bacterium]
MDTFNPAEALQAYLDGELTLAETTSLEAALAADPALRQRLEILRRGAAAVAEHGLPVLPDAVRHSLDAVLARATQPWWVRGLPGGGRSAATAVWGLATTTTLGLALLLVPICAKPRLAVNRAEVVYFDVAAAGSDRATEAKPIAPAALAPMAGPGAPAAASAKRSGTAETRWMAPESAVVQAAPPVTGGAALEAGEIDDNQLFGKYRDYSQRYGGAGYVQRRDMGRRRVVQVVDPQGRAVPSVLVELISAYDQGELWRAVTDSAGRVYLYDGLRGANDMVSEVRLTAPSGEVLTRQPSFEGSRRMATFTLPTRLDFAAPPKLDVAFLIDTTGSMGEEIDRLRAAVAQVSEQLARLPQQPRLRLALVAYRDLGDDYVVRHVPFTSNLAQFRRALAPLRADGGGDTPEHVEAALNVAVNRLEWVRGPGVRLAFLIGDAPPQDHGNVPSYLESATRAAERGIKVCTISSSGNDDAGEYVWRQIAAVTGGRFLFITKGDDQPGAPRGSTPHHVDRQDYTVRRLPDLIRGQIERELDQWGCPPPPLAEVADAAPPSPVAPVPPTPPPPVRPPWRLAWPAHTPLYLLGAVLLINLIGWGLAWRYSLQTPRPRRPRP